MDQDQTNNDTQTNELQSADNDDLQKAIDSITNTTNVDPVFSDPVAAPSTIPEGDTGELDESVGPFPAPEPEPAPAPEPQVEMPAPAPEPIAPIDPVAIPDLSAAPLPDLGTAPEPTVTPNPTPVITNESDTEEQSSEPLSMHQVKEAALRDLVPLLDHLNMEPDQKFNLYRDIFQELKDYTVLEPAYKAAKNISDDTKRAEALLYLVEAIDKM